MPSLAFVFAHPDDETFAVGGTIAAHAARGIRCDLFCATNGDAGRSSGVPVSSREELAALRRNELISAARILGIENLEMPGHPDGALAGVDQDLLIGQIVGCLRAWKADVVITFGPEGGRNSHRDHKAIGRAATAAFFLAGVSARLYYCAWQPPKPGEELRGTSLPPTVGVAIDDASRAAKRAALLAHVTQSTLLPRFEQADTAIEWFALAAGKPQAEEMSNDLLAGIRQE